ncbi:MAG TPA: right-handed parallel beta-helix repeat-containing protein, partial [Armatimonadota bacterium]
ALKSGVGLYGGFAGSETDRTQRDPKQRATILDGTIATLGAYIYGATVITIPAGSGPDTVVDGFTIQNGESPMGAGICILGGAPVISNNVFNKNGAGILGQMTLPDTSGGGIYIADGTATVTGNVFTGNAALNGGGICIQNGAPVISSNVIGPSNYAKYGAGVCSLQGTPLIVSNDISGNRGSYGGGAYILSGLLRDSQITNNRVAGGRQELAGGAGLWLGAAGVAAHNRIVGNGDPLDGTWPGGGGAFVEGTLLDNVIQDNYAFYGNALMTWGASVVSRNLITYAGSSSLNSQVLSYGGAFTDNLLVSQSSSGIELWAAAAPPLIANNTIINVGETGAPTAKRNGIINEYGAGEQPTIANNILVGWDRAGWTYDRGSAKPFFTVTHNDPYGNVDNALDFPGTAADNKVRNPLFADAASGDYHLTAGSPCIDAGNDAYIASSDRDLANAPRISGAHVDIGAYEYGSPLYTILDAAEVLRIAAGISVSTPANVSRLDVVQETPGTTSLSVADATRIAQWLLN